MEPHPRDPGRTAWALPCLLLLALPGVGAQAGQGFSLQQPQDNVTVAAGETLTLNCTTSGIAGPGPVKWLKGWGSGNKTVYGQKGDSLPSVTRAVVESNTDFTIHIRNVQPEDMGTYYCVKYVKTDTGVDEVSHHGRGTVVSVQAKPSPPLMSGPRQRARPGQSVPFVCTTGGFFPEKIGVKWFKNKDPMVAQVPLVTEWRMKTYNMSSTVMVTLQKDDVRSQLICEVQHSTLPAPLRGRFQLSSVLRVPPSVEVRAEPSPVEVNNTVVFTCLVKEFYPGKVSISWLENGMEIKAENVSRLSELPQGLFELRSQVEVQAMEEKNGSTITCMVVHDAQAPANYSAVLWISNTAQGLSKESQMIKDDMLIYIVVGVVCTVLVLLVAAILYLIRVKQIKGKSSPSARLHEPEKSSEATTQESDPNNLTYADLNFDKERKTIRRMVEMSQQSEYACIQTNQAPNGDDNLTYADLDMVHLSKAPKRPAPRPEEAGSEYASVQITRK
ncbi:PREDICTED: tyrosine-protein phosphatase non-receptor type substrate 1 isoform X2 [Pseudopodoces humilis]|uniref:tyrosine-protein phosphatase non-receptor type substrate 1 isoform X1 n=1 Tax=Pseudopodoces humilis TaxID=181119 RepID=UPI0006B866DB|nr:PREDICTED: tyrosine-protein phosphatase non-receptor type substrate 1 isoform X1 [Pseudopodoces humilis]XP_014109534.1 PREDICTED: tyrosine-protein phosphatase non-receptor type substrate 1 isoform X2 [Pseudopodoces humilis]